MIKKLPHGFTYEDLDELLAHTELYQYVKRRHIPKEVFERRYDVFSPPAVAFVHFDTAEHAELGLNTLWHLSVWDRDEECDRIINTVHANSNWKPSTPEISPEPSPETTSWKGEFNKSGTRWTVKGTSKPTEEEVLPTPNDTMLAITDGTENQKSSTKATQKNNKSFGSWYVTSWDKTQWETSSSHEHTDAWWTAHEETYQAQDISQQHIQYDEPPNFPPPRFKCINCYQPFVKWSQCVHHMKSVCLPRGADPNIIDDDDDLRKICERLCAPFERSVNPLTS